LDYTGRMNDRNGALAVSWFAVGLSAPGGDAARRVSTFGFWRELKVKARLGKCTGPRSRCIRDC